VVRGGKTRVERSTLGQHGRCSCGRWLAAAATYSYRSRTDRYLFHRCECGNEWTEHQTGIDPTDPVSSDEVIEVHTRLAKFAGSISELLYHAT
jgi:hypothetical protein